MQQLASRRGAMALPAQQQRPGPVLAARRVTNSRQLCAHVRCSAATSAAAAAAADPKLWEELKLSTAAFKKAPPSMKLEFSSDVLAAMNDLKAAGAVPKWGSEAPAEAGADDAPGFGSGPGARRNVFNGELRQMGIKNPDQLATPSTRNDFVFLASVMGVFGVLAVLAGQLPGDWGFFTSYLLGSVILVVMGIGSTAPGLLQVVIDKFSLVFPDYRERVVAHEAAHLLVGYLVGVPVTSYSVGIGQEHVEFAEAKLQARIFTRDLSDPEVDALAVVAVAGMAAEGLRYEEVVGQNADLFDLQRILLRSKSKLSAQQQQSVTRWAVWRAAALLKQYAPEHEAVQQALARGEGVDRVVAAIEAVPARAAAA